MNGNKANCISKALVTFAIGSYIDFLAISRPSFMAYTERHDYDYLEYQARADLLDSTRAPSWSKVPVLLDALQSYEQVLWVDCDAVIVNSVIDITEQGPADAWQALAIHTRHNHQELGEVPSCGTWLVRRPMIPILQQLWSMVQYLDHPWWEQAALHELLGFVHNGVDPFPVRRGQETELRRHTHFLPIEWASLDYADLYAHPNIVHVPNVFSFQNRLNVMRAWAKRAEKNNAVSRYHHWLAEVEGELV